MALIDRWRAARRFDASRFLPFEVNGHCVGQVRRDLAEQLRDFPDVFELGQRVRLHARLDNAEQRSRAMAQVAWALSERGALTRWRDETYEVGSEVAGRSLFVLERAAVRFFGCMARAVHVNGIVRDAGGESMWIARRSIDKPIDPGMLDNLIGGGLAAGSSVYATLLKEAWEEAGLEARIAAAARPAGIVRITREVPEGLHAETIFAHDLVLPPDLEPRNQDGEVAQFRCMPLAALIDELETDAPYTVDAAMVILHYLVRVGHITPEHPNYEQLAALA